MEHSDARQSITGKINNSDTCIGGAGVGDAEKAGSKADSIQSVENRNFFETKEVTIYS